MSKEFYTLWNPPPHDQWDKILGLEHIDLGKLEQFIKDIALKQKECEHEKVYRFGPSYTRRRDGSYNAHEEYICTSCGTESQEPIGRYKF